MLLGNTAQELNDSNAKENRYDCRGTCMSGKAFLTCSFNKNIEEKGEETLLVTIKYIVFVSGFGGRD